MGSATGAVSARMAPVPPPNGDRIAVPETTYSPADTKNIRLLQRGSDAAKSGSSVKARITVGNEVVNDRASTCTGNRHQKLVTGKEIIGNRDARPSGR